MPQRLDFPRSIRSAALVALAALSLPASATAQEVTCDRVAATSGADTAAGTAVAPFRTVQRLADSLSAGQTGCVRSGTYAPASGSYVLRAERPGAPGAPVTIRSYPGERARLAGIVHVPSSAPFVTLSHLDIEGDGTMNVVKVYAENFTLADSRVTNLSRPYSCVMLGSASAGAAIRPSIVRNVLHDCGTNVTNKDHAIYAARVQGGEIVDNVIINPAAYAVQLYPNAQGVHVAHNVVDGGRTVRGGVVLGGEATVASSDNVVEQNVIANPATYAVATYWPGAVGTGNVARDNCIHGGTMAAEIGFASQGTLVADPRFVDPAARDYRLAPDSPCLTRVGYDTAAKLAGAFAPAAPAPVAEPIGDPAPEPGPVVAPAPASEAPPELPAVNLPPAVKLLSPVSGATLMRVVDFAATVTDDEGAAKVEYYVDGRLVATAGAAPWRARWKVSRRLRSGIHVAVAKAYDAQGLSATSEPVTFLH